MVYGPFSLADATNASMEFDTWYGTEPNHDSLSFGASVDGTDFYTESRSGNRESWGHETLDFADIAAVDVVGAPQVWVAFIFTSDSRGNGPGAFVANVVIKKSTEPPPCSFSISPASQSFAAAGGSNTVEVSVISGSICSWTAVSQAPWITITAGANGTDDGTVTYSVAANATSLPRTGTITVAGQTCTVTQSPEPPPCIFSISPSSEEFQAEGGSGTVAVTMTSGSYCPWTAASEAPWITITAGANGTDSGTVSYSVAMNPATSARTGTITVGGQILTVTQARATPINSSVWLPVATHASGANNSTWRTDLGLLNVGVYDCTATLRLHTAVES